MKLIVCSSLVLLPSLIWAQGTLADYQRGQELQAKARALVINAPGAPNWIGSSDHFWYAKPVKGGSQFVLVDADGKTKKPAFDHDKLAAAISAASGQHYTGLALPFVPAGGRGGGRGAGPAPGALTFHDNEGAIEFGAAGFLWSCTLNDYACTKGAAMPQAPTGGRGRGGAPDADSDLLLAPEPVGGDPADGLEYLMPAPPQDEGPGGGSAVAQRNPCANNEAGQGRGGRGGGRGAAAGESAAQVCRSFDGKWEALIQNFNVFLRPVGGSDPATPLSFDGSEGNYYTLQSIAWSPDSKKLVGLPYAARVRPAGPLYRVVARRSDPAKAYFQVLPQAWGRPGHGVSRAVRSRHEKRNRDRPRAIPQRLRIGVAGMVEGQPRLHFRVQPARPPGIPDDRSGRADRQSPRADRRTEQDVHLLQRTGAGHVGWADDIVTT